METGDGSAEPGSSGFLSIGGVIPQVSNPLGDMEIALGLRIALLIVLAILTGLVILMLGYFIRRRA